MTHYALAMLILSFLLTLPFSNNNISNKYGVLFEILKLMLLSQFVLSIFNFLANKSLIIVEYLVKRIYLQMGFLLPAIL